MFRMELQKNIWRWRKKQYSPPLKLDLQGYKKKKHILLGQFFPAPYLMEDAPSTTFHERQGQERLGQRQERLGSRQERLGQGQERLGPITRSMSKRVEEDLDQAYVSKKTHQV